jgi:hypothetical protein
MTRSIFPSLPLDAWQPTKDTLHLYLQIVGKVRMNLHPRINHWWHVPLYVSPRGLTTRAIPFNGGNFEIEFDLKSHELVISTSSGAVESFALHDGLSVADFNANLFASLVKLGITPTIKGIPFEAPSKTQPSETPFAEDHDHRSYDKVYVEKAHQVLVAVDDIFEEFRGRFTGKSTPVHVFWHSFDLALTRFSGRAVTPREGAGSVEREAYSHEVISFGFWFGDENVPAPAFYSYTAPEPAGLAEEPLSSPASWQEANGSHMALLMYDDVRNAENPRDLVLKFLESAYEAGGKRADWDVEAFQLKSGI